VEASPKEATMDKSIAQMGQDLAHAAYAESTRRKYLKTAEMLSAHFAKPVAEIGRDELRAFVEHLREQKRIRCTSPVLPA
jgi:integrase-like protein